MSASELGGLAMIVGWLAWGIFWAGALRVVLAATGRRLGLAPLKALALAYLGMIVVAVGSAFLHQAVFGNGVMYGATPRQAFSLIAYFLAPFGLPLIVGGFFFGWIDMIRGSIKAARAHNQ